MAEEQFDPRAGDSGAGTKSCSGEPDTPATTGPQPARQELEADRGAIGEFVNAIFRRADPDGYVLLRTFTNDRPWQPWRWYAIEVGDTRKLVQFATHRAGASANAPEPVVFCPPLATFRDAKDGQAREENLANGLVISVECDSQPAKARAILEQVLGTPTVIVASGGEWVDPDTCEVHPKLHLHWRLAVPTRTAAEHELLKRARRLAQVLAASDATAVPICHPMRWPGSWHRKGEPKLARIVGGDFDREIHLAAAVATLTEAAGPLPESEPAEELTGEIGEVAAYLWCIPNDGEANGGEASGRGPLPGAPYEDWERVLLAIGGATACSDDGFRLFSEWSARSPKDDPATNARRWAGMRRNPPSRIGIGTLRHLACLHEPPMAKDVATVEEMIEDMQRVLTRREATVPVSSTGEVRGADEIDVPAVSLAPLTVSAPPTGAPPALVHRPETPPAAPAAVAAPAPKPAPAARSWPFTDILSGEDLAPAFPTAVLPQPFRAFVEDVADRMQVPPDYAAIPVLVAAATMVGREYRITPKLHDNWQERACLWGMVIAPPSARKSPPMAEAMRPVVTMQREMWDRYREEHVIWKRRKQEKDPELGPEPLLETVYTAEVTVEALVPLMAREGNANPRGVVLFRDELSGWFSSMNKYRQRGGDDRPFYLQCWSGGAFRVDRKSTGTVFADDLYLNVIGTIQPGVVRDVLRGGDIDGMTARFGLMAWPRLPDRVDVVDRRPDINAIRDVEARLRSIRAASPLDGAGRVLRFSGEAYSIFSRWLLRNQNRPEVRGDDGFAAHLAKYPGLFARLALTLHFMRHGGGALAEVGPETAEAVRMLIDDYLELHAQRVYGMLSAHPARAGAVQIAAWVRERRIETFTARDVSRNNWKEFSAATDERPLIEAALRYLEAHDWIQLVEKRSGPRGGRPTIEAHVNPAVYL